MPVSPELQALISAGLEEVHQSPKFILSAQRRHTLYRSLCPDADRAVAKSPISRLEFFERLRDSKELGLPQGFRQYAWLIALTARYAQPVLEQFVAHAPSTPEMAGIIRLSALPATILGVAERVIQNDIGFDEASDLLCEDFYYGMSGLDHAFTYPISCAVKTAYDALNMILFGYQPGSHDVAWLTVEAHTAIDENERGVWMRNYFSIDAISPRHYSAYFLDEATVADRKTGYPSIYQPPLPIRYDLNKRLRLWEWWLTETIPEAWARGEA